MPSITSAPGDRKALLGHYRRSPDADQRLRSHINLLLDAGHPWATISAALFCSFNTISRWKRRFEAEGVNAIEGRPGAGGGRASTSGRRWWCGGF